MSTGTSGYREISVYRYNYAQTMPFSIIENTGLTVPWISVLKAFFGRFSGTQDRPWIAVRFLYQKLTGLPRPNDTTFTMYVFNSAKVHENSQKSARNQQLIEIRDLLTVRHDSGT